MIKPINVAEYRKEFPILLRKINDNTLIYFDNAATAQKPLSVALAFEEHYGHSHANVHRASHTLSAEATIAFEDSRQQIQKFINATSEKEIIWTKGATESINLVAQTWGISTLKQNDEIILSYSEHHANIVPWQMLAEKTGVKIKVASLDEAGLIDVKALTALVTERTKLIACTHISNVVGKFNDISKIISLAKKHNIVTLIDGSQAVAHTKVDVQTIDCDFYVFSAHKMFGPNGVGVLYGRQSLLEKMPPYQGGGEMIEKVSFNKTTYAELPFKFEPGTPNISAVIAFAEAISFMDKYKTFAQTHEVELIDYCYKRLNEIEELKHLFLEKPDIPLFSFTLKNAHNYDLATYLNTQGIAVRSGHHCAMPLMEYKQVNGCLRVSLAAYNTFSEVDILINAVNDYIKQNDAGYLKADLADNTFLTIRPLTEVISEIIPETTPVSTEAQSSASIQKTQADMESHFAGSHSWDSRHRLIMLLGKELERLPPEQKTDLNLIDGCESSAWLIHEVTQENNSDEKIIVFKGDSDAKVIRGLLLIVFAAINHQSPTAILNVNMPAFFERLGLLSHLSPSRGNGLNAIVKRVMEIAYLHK